MQKVTPQTDPIWRPISTGNLPNWPLTSTDTSEKINVNNFHYIKSDTPIVNIYILPNKNIGIDYDDGHSYKDFDINLDNEGNEILQVSDSDNTNILFSFAPDFLTKLKTLFNTSTTYTITLIYPTSSNMRNTILSIIKNDGNVTADQIPNLLTLDLTSSIAIYLLNNFPNIRKIIGQ